MRLSVLLHVIKNAVSIANIYRNLQKLSHEIFSAVKKTRYLNVGQCLPAACTAEDASTILANDPASIALNQAETQVNGSTSKATEVHIIDSRAVPGDFNIWRERKFYLFA